MIDLYGGTEELVRNQLTCQHDWTDVNVDFISLYAKCKSCYVVRRFINTYDYYYANLIDFFKRTIVTELKHHFVEHPGYSLKYETNVSFLIPYNSVFKGKDTALEDVLKRNEINNPKETFGIKKIQTLCQYCGEYRQYTTFDSVPLENVKCSCNKTYLVLYHTVDEKDYLAIIEHKSSLVYSDINTSLGGKKVEYKNTKTTDELLKELSQCVINANQATSNRIDEMAQRISVLEQHVSRESNNTSKA